MKKEKIFLGSHCLLHQEKIRQWRNLRRSDSFEIDFICCQSHQKPSITHLLIWCFVWEMRAEHSGRLFHLNIR